MFPLNARSSALRMFSTSGIYFGDVDWNSLSDLFPSANRVRRDDKEGLLLPGQQQQATSHGARQTRERLASERR